MSREKKSTIQMCNRTVAHHARHRYPATRRLHMESFDRIEKRVTLRAPVSRVWQAIANTKEFGRWFGVTLEGDFVAGMPITGTFSSLPSEAAILEHQKRLGLPPSKVRLPEASIVFCTPERIEPEHY